MEPAVTLEDVVRHAWAGICVVVVVVAAGCGGGEISLTEYAEELNAIVGRAGRRWEAYVATPQGEVLVAGREQLTEFCNTAFTGGLKLSSRSTPIR